MKRRLIVGVHSFEDEMKNIGVIFLRGIIKFLALFPLKMHYFWADVIASILRKTHYRRNVIMTNLARSFPEKLYYELDRMANAFYTHMAELIVETIWFAGATPERLRKSGIVTVANPQLLFSSYNEAPSIMVLYSHCGNWEVLGGIETYLKMSTPQEGQNEVNINEENFKIVYKKLSSHTWDEFLKRNRTAPTTDFHGLVETGQLMRFIAGHRREKLAYFLNVDQSPYAGAGAYDIGAFLNQPTQAAFGPAGLAHRLGMAVLYMSFNRLSRGHYELSFTQICPDASKMKTAYIVREYYNLLENEIKSNPANWLWSHRRWKQRTQVMQADLDAYDDK